MLSFMLSSSDQPGLTFVPETDKASLDGNDSCRHFGRKVARILKIKGVRKPLSLVCIGKVAKQVIVTGVFPKEPRPGGL